MERVLVLAHRFRDEDQKKFLLRNLRIRRDVHPCFRHRPKVISRLGKTSSFLGETAPKKHSSGSGPVTLFWAQSSLGGTFFSRGAQAVI